MSFRGFQGTGLAVAALMVIAYSHFGHAMEGGQGQGQVTVEQKQLEEGEWLGLIRPRYTQFVDQVGEVQRILDDDSNELQRFEADQSIFRDALRQARNLADYLNCDWQLPTDISRDDLLIETEPVKLQMRCLKLSSPRCNQFKCISFELLRCFCGGCCYKCYDGPEHKSCCYGDTEEERKCLKHASYACCWPFMLPFDLLCCGVQALFPCNWDGSDAHCPKIFREPAEYALNRELIREWVRKFRWLIIKATKEIDSASMASNRSPDNPHSAKAESSPSAPELPPYGE